jgi:hypothetical protein
MPGVLIRRVCAAMLLVAACLFNAASAQQRQNYFDDPFMQATSALKGCLAPEPPLFTQQELRDLAHVRAQHGTSCYYSGRCRLPNSYLYDKEIVPRVAQYIQRDGRFDDTSVWVLGQRRVVTLKGCVATREQAQALEQRVMLVDDVMNVVNELMVGTQGKPPYTPAEQAAKR